MIPKIIHYCWFGNSELPLSAKKCIDSWKKYCPDYEIIQWDESNYDYKKIRYTKEAYEEKKYAFVSDVARLEVVYEYGGIYLDTDVELIRPLDALLIHKAFMGIETSDVALGLGFGAEPNFPFVKGLIEIYKGLQFVNEDGSYNLKTIPQYTTEFLKGKGFQICNSIQTFEGITIYPSEYFNPQNYLTGEVEITGNTFSIHHYDASWWGEAEKREYEKEQLIYKRFGKGGLAFFHARKVFKEKGLKGVINKLRETIWKK